MSRLHEIKAQKEANLRKKVQARAVREAEELLDRSKHVSKHLKVLEALRQHKPKKRELRNRPDARFEQALDLARKYGLTHDPRDWVPRGKSPETRFISYCEHILAAYPCPKFFWSVFDEPDHNLKALLLNLVRKLAGGASLYKISVAGIYGMTLPLTKRMCHDFMVGRQEPTFMRALRWAQVKNLGGDRRLFEAFMRIRGNCFNAREWEEFYASVLAWFARQDMVNPDVIGPLFDYLIHRRGGDPAFSMAGRSVQALMQGMAQWHNELSKTKPSKDVVQFPKSGLHDGVYKQPVDGVDCLWYVEEILTSKKLKDESTELKHCVFSYTDSIVRGWCSVWSLYPNYPNIQHRATIEVRQRKIVQARGVCNKPLTKEAYRVMIGWANQNGLRIEKYV